MAIWYIAVNGQQQGPLALDEVLLIVREKGASNVHVYREGFTDWKLASEVADVTRRLKLLPPLQTSEPAPSAQPPASPASVPSTIPSRSSSPAPIPTANPEPALPATRGGNFIGRHWRGEFPLWISYWIVALLGSLFVQGIRIKLLRDATPEAGALAVPATIVASGILLIVSVWQVVGLWRSAANYKRMRRAGGQAVLWGVVVQLLVIIWIAIWIGGAVFSVMGMM